MITAIRIGPAKYAMPEPGQGGEVEVVFQPCTGKLLKTAQAGRSGEDAQARLGRRRPGRQRASVAAASGASSGLGNRSWAGLVRA
ncbi:hypothetical protein ACRAWD_28730 [Caulobacter segnis]